MISRLCGPIGENARRGPYHELTWRVADYQNWHPSRVKIGPIRQFLDRSFKLLMLCSLGCNDPFLNRTIPRSITAYTIAQCRRRGIYTYLFS